MNDKNRMQIIAENITYYRKQKGVTQKELAKQIGLTPSTMSDYMNLRSAPSFGVIQKLADYFEIKKSDIDTTFKDEEAARVSKELQIPISALGIEIPDKLENALESVVSSTPNDSHDDDNEHN